MKLIVYTLASALLVIVMSIALIVWWAQASAAHEWYDAACCSGQDCAAIPSSAVSATPNGYVLTLEAEDHPILTAPFSGGVAYSRTRESRDGEFHACFSAYDQRLLCLYAPLMGY